MATMFSAIRLSIVAVAVALPLSGCYFADGAAQLVKMANEHPTDKNRSAAPTAQSQPSRPPAAEPPAAQPAPRSSISVETLPPQ